MSSDFSVKLGMTRTIKQPLGSGLCLAACAATLLGENKSAFNAWSLSGYIKKMPEKLCPHLTDRRYMDLSDLTIILALRGYRLGSWWNSGDALNVKFGLDTQKYAVEHYLDESPALVLVRCEGEPADITHAVIYDNEAQGIRDPSNGAGEDVCNIEDYWIAEWFPVDTFPKEPVT